MRIAVWESSAHGQKVNAQKVDASKMRLINGLSTLPLDLI